MEIVRMYARVNGLGQIIFIKHGEQGYYKTNALRDRGEVKVYNKIHGNTENEAVAAETCSMFDIWDKFDDIVAKLDMIDDATKH